MAFRISGAAIRNPIPPLVLFAVLTLLGLVSFAMLPITRAPNVDVPVVAVTVTQSGAAPAELEAQVTKKIEDAVANITGVKHVNSTVTDGSSLTVIELAPRGQQRPGDERRSGRRIQDQGRPAPRHRRTHRRADRRRGPKHPDVRRDCPGHDAGKACPGS